MPKNKTETVGTAWLRCAINGPNIVPSLTHNALWATIGLFSQGPVELIFAMNDDPLVILYGCAELRRPLRKQGLVTSSVRGLRQIMEPTEDLTARAIVIGSTAYKQHQKAEIIIKLRETWPMVDVVIWAPKASGSMVRDALRSGAADVLLGSSPDLCATEIRKLVESQQLLPRAVRLGEERHEESEFEGMFARTRKMWDLFDIATRIAPTDATILVLGETGTGKELLARAIHKHSARKGRFVPLNCGAIDESLLNSELFGHFKGAFTGASHDKDGLFMHAKSGTLFLDEIGNLPLAAQYHLLRALQEGAIRPVGGHEEQEIDVRVIAATSNALDADVRRGKFREDLFYRLDVLRLELPPLRERPEDIVFLFAHFARKYSENYNVERPELREEFLDALVKYDWPGNVRQLENFTERLILTHCGQLVGASEFQELVPSQDSTAHPTKRMTTKIKFDGQNAFVIDTGKSLRETLDPHIAQLECQYLEDCLRSCRGRVGAAAKLAGIGRRTLTRKMSHYGLDKATYRDV